MDSELFGILYVVAILGLVNLFLRKYVKNPEHEGIFYFILLIIYIILKDHPIIKTKAPTYAETQQNMEGLSLHAVTPENRKYITCRNVIFGNKRNYRKLKKYGYVAFPRTTR